ncbi:MAG: hypothetical protein ABH804_01085 [archaeon]
MERISEKGLTVRLSNGILASYVGQRRVEFGFFKDEDNKAIRNKSPEGATHYYVVETSMTPGTKLSAKVLYFKEIPADPAKK